MRLKKSIKLFVLFSLIFFLKGTDIVNAQGCGDVCYNTVVREFTSSAWFSCPSGQTIQINCQDNAGASGTYVIGTTGTYWNPAGDNTTICTNTCDSEIAVNQVVETYSYLCPCPVEPTTNNNTNTDTTTTTTTEEFGPPAAPPANTMLVTGSTNLDVDAALSGSFCSQATSAPIFINGISLTAADINNSQTSSPVVDSNFVIDAVYYGNDYTVTLDLSGQIGTNYVCSCPAAVDPSNPYLCQYSGVETPSSNVNFYLKEYNLSNNSWIQIFGSNIFARTEIASEIPYSFCVADANCQAAMLVPKAGSINSLSSGFPIISTLDSSKIKSSPSSTVYHSYLHLEDRGNANSYGVIADMQELSYDYFYNLAENSVHQIGNGEDLEPLLSDWTGAAWWSISDINYVVVDGNVSIDESQGFNLTSSQNLVVFVDGNLTIDDSNPNDTNRKITSVANGGFLAFIVKGNVLVTPNVGYELNPLIPTIPVVSNANSNVEGVFIADGNLTIQTKLATGEVPPDKKFIGSGTFVSWTNILTPRIFDDGSFGAILNNNQAIDNFIYRPDLLVNWPTKLKASISNWREVDPQLINQ